MRTVFSAFLPALLPALAGGVLLLAAGGVGITSAQAAQVEVKMLNRGAAGNFVFEPALIRIKPGDSVHFVATTKGHDAASVPGMLPKGAQPFAGKMSQDVTVTFKVPGVYGIECRPHYAMGMVALVVAGNPVNLDQAKAVKHPGKANRVFADLFKQYAATAKPGK